MNGEVIILTGPPAAGKTTVARSSPATRAPWFLPPFRTIAERDGLTVSYVVLRPDLDTTLSRAKERIGDDLKDVDAITGLHGAFAQLGELENHAIDTRDLEAKQTAAEVRRVLTSGTYRLTR